MDFNGFTQADRDLIARDYALLKESAAGRCRNDRELAVVQKAFDFANEAHKNVRRRSGEPYMLHPIAVARIVVEDISLGYKSIAAALLHDVVEDTEYTVDDIRALFGDKIASLVDGLTKIKTVLDSNRDSDSLQAENFKRILLTLNDDVRVVLIKLADRLHNCRTIEYMPEHKRDKILSETMYIFIPLAHRLGLYNIKSEMENIWLRYKEPEEYEEITGRIDANVDRRSAQIEEFIGPIEEALGAEGYRFSIKRRIKTPYSVWRKMRTKNIEFDEIYDLYAVRIIFDSGTEDPAEERKMCYQIYSTVTSLYRYQPDRLRDWVKQPKSNGYEALHCTLMSAGGFWIECQIRSRRMDDIAEKGIAAHWAYKRDGYASENDSEMDKWLGKIKSILESPDVSSLELLDIVHKDLVSSEITVFTPKGSQRVIQNGATALDFAYLIHSDIGNHAIAAKVNMKLAPLSTFLHSGDQVEIITAESAEPAVNWMGMLNTRHARRILTEWLKEHKPDELSKMSGLSESSGQEPERVYIRSGVGYHIATCCHPIPGDPVIGFKNEDGSIVIHKKTCRVAQGLASVHGENIVVPVFDRSAADETFPVLISLKGIDRVGLLNDLTQRISKLMGINIRRLLLGSDNGVFDGQIEVLVSDRSVVTEMISKIEKVSGIESVQRTDL